MLAAAGSRLLKEADMIVARLSRLIAAPALAATHMPSDGSQENPPFLINPA
jgi:hypothetical protein